MKAKRILAAVVASAISIGVVSALPTVAEEATPAVMDVNVYNAEESDESLFTFSYYETDDGDKYARVDGLSDLGEDVKDIVIPSEVSDPDGDGKIPVTTIKSSAFHVCTNLTSVIIPDSITSIGSSAF